MDCGGNRAPGNSSGDSTLSFELAKDSKVTTSSLIQPLKVDVECIEIRLAALPRSCRGPFPSCSRGQPEIPQLDEVCREMGRDPLFSLWSSDRSTTMATTRALTSYGRGPPKVHRRRRIRGIEGPYIQVSDYRTILAVNARVAADNYFASRRTLEGTSWIS